PAGSNGGATNTAPAAPTQSAPANFSASSTANQAADNGGNTSGTTGGINLANPLAAAQAAIFQQATGADNPSKAPSATPAAASAAAAPTPTITAYFTINKSAGMVSVFGTAKQQKLVGQYLRSVAAKANAQVLIEAKVVEVDLSDQFKSGVDWQQIL